MIITVASFKGGVGKTTTAIHLAAYMHTKAPTLLIDGDLNRSATKWGRRGNLPFRVVDERQAVRFARQYEHLVIDTQARPEEEDLEALADGCDLLVIPASPDVLALEAMVLTVNALTRLNNDRYRVLLTLVPPPPSRDGEQARASLRDMGLPIFAGSIRRAAAFQKAALIGVAVNQLKDGRAQRGWLDYVSVGREIMHESAAFTLDEEAADALEAHDDGQAARSASTMTQVLVDTRPTRAPDPRAGLAPARVQLSDADQPLAAPPPPAHQPPATAGSADQDELPDPRTVVEVALAGLGSHDGAAARPQSRVHTAHDEDDDDADGADADDLDDALGWVSTGPDVDAEPTVEADADEPAEREAEERAAESTAADRGRPGAAEQPDRERSHGESDRPDARAREEADRASHDHDRERKDREVHGRDAGGELSHSGWIAASRSTDGS